MTSQQRQRRRINLDAFTQIIRSNVSSVGQRSITYEENAPYLPKQIATSAQCVWEEKGGAKLYLSDAKGVDLTDPSTLLEANVHAIVNCTPRPNSLPENVFQYCQVPVHDNAAANIGAYFAAVCHFLQHQLQESNHSVIVHCMAGVSRSATIVLAYLMHCHSLSLDDAFRTVRSRRPIAQPNPGFWAQLIVWQGTTDDVTKRIVGVSDGAEDWPYRSLALFATLRNVPGTEYEDLCFRNLSATSDRIYQAVDFVWGHGVSDFALDWLCSFCKNGGGADSIIAMVEDPDSEFSRLFEGEIYPWQVEKLKKALAKAVQKE